MRWTQTLIPTLRESPADAEILSHQLLLRAGIVRKLAAGLYNFMPLGTRTLHKIQEIIRQELDRAGALEILMPALQPSEIWQASGRYEAAADTLFKVSDHSKREWVLGPTHGRWFPPWPLEKSIAIGSYRSIFTKYKQSFAMKYAHALV